jgi:hypothetical protein
MGGLWLRSPDLDAVTWLNGPVCGLAQVGPDVVVLDHRTWSPINTQNTSIVRDLMPVLACVPMGWRVPGGTLERFGDIWGGYFVQSVIDTTPFHVAFGKPLVEHRRNSHNYVDDLRREFWGMLLTDWLVDVLRESFQPAECTVLGRVEELSEFLAGAASAKLPSWSPPEMKEFVASTAETLLDWGNVCRTLL